jgi:hypothetical protein
MNWEEFALWTYALVELGRLSLDQAEDARAQRRMFDDQRESLEELHDLIVGFVAGELMVADSAVTLIDAAIEHHGSGRQVYFERISTAGA